MAQFYTLDEAAKVLGMNADELKQKAQHREVRAFLDSGSWRFRVSDIDELARRRGMGSDPELSLSDLDLPAGTSEGTGETDITDDSVFQLGVARSDLGQGSMESFPSQESGSDADILLDDSSLPMGGGSSSHILGMESPGKQPSDSDVRLVPEDGPKGASDSDVQLSGEINVVPPLTPGDSDVTLVHENTQEAFDAFGSGDQPGLASSSNFTVSPEGGSSDETTLRPSPIGSSGELRAEDGLISEEEDSDFELTPSSVIDALQPESGSDFELTALDASDEFESAAPRPSDSDVTGAEPSTSGVNLGRPSDSGINLQQVGGLGGGDADSIELAPLEDEDQAQQRPAAKQPAPRPAAARPDPGATAMPGLSPSSDPGATAMPGLSPTSDPSATALPVRDQGQKDIFEDTDFEVDALDSGEDQTIQIDAHSDFDLDESDSASEVFALDEEDVDQSAATALGPALGDSDALSGSMDAEVSDSEEMGEVGWDEDLEPSDAAAAAVAAPAAAPAAGRKGGGALLTDAGGPPWGGIWVGVLGVTTVLMMLLAFVTMDVVRNLNSYQSDTPVASGLVNLIAPGD